MFELTVQREFCAAHALSIDGKREHSHGHNFRVTVAVAAPSLDADGLVCDFHAVEHALAAVLEPWAGRDLNLAPPFDRLNPSAENIARAICDSVAARLAGVLPRGARVTGVTVTEAPGCAATYRPPG